MTDALQVINTTKIAVVLVASKIGERVVVELLFFL